MDDNSKSNGNGRELAQDPVLRTFIDEVRSGRRWADALLDAIRDWRMADEIVGDRHYRYLIGGEAFDWLVLVERLLDEVADYVPDSERVALIFQSRWPEDISEEVFRERVGAARSAAHLNFLYGVVVEEALQLAFEIDVQKEKTSRVWGDDHRTLESEQALVRLYGEPLRKLLALFQEERPDIHLPPDALGLGDLKEFTYWLFKYRVRWADPARVASDTRRGLAQLSRMESEARPRRRLQAVAEPAEFLETSGWFAHSS